MKTLTISRVIPQSAIPALALGALAGSCAAEAASF